MASIEGCLALASSSSTLIGDALSGMTGFQRRFCTHLTVEHLGPAGERANHLPFGDVLKLEGHDARRLPGKTTDHSLEAFVSEAGEGRVDPFDVPAFGVLRMGQQYVYRGLPRLKGGVCQTDDISYGIPLAAGARKSAGAAAPQSVTVTLGEIEDQLSPRRQLRLGGG